MAIQAVLELELTITNAVITAPKINNQGFWFVCLTKRKGAAVQINNANNEGSGNKPLTLPIPSGTSDERKRT